MELTKEDLLELIKEKSDQEMGTNKQCVIDHFGLPDNSAQRRIIGKLAKELKDMDLIETVSLLSCDNGYCGRGYILKYPRYFQTV